MLNEDFSSSTRALGYRRKFLVPYLDDLKNFIGSETTRRGMLRIFEMLQNQTLNKRLFYVLLENLLLTLFPDNKFNEIFNKLHSQSPRIRARKEMRHEQERATQQADRDSLRRRRDVR